MMSMAIDEKELENLLDSIDSMNLSPNGENGLLKLSDKEIIEPAKGAEMDQYLGYVKHEPFSLTM
jgi:hypothetical protein